MALHNKRRNCGLIYELLAREIADAAVSNDTGRAAAALETVAEHLGDGTILAEELSVHRSVFEARGCSERLARSIVDQLKAASVRLSTREQRRQAAKTALIHEMNRRFGREVFDRRVPDYQAHASIGIMLARGVGRITEGVDLARVEEALVSFLTMPPAEQASVDPHANGLAYRAAVKLYQEEYGGALNSSQSELLREYVRHTLGGNSAPLDRMIARQRSGIIDELIRSRLDEEFVKDADMRGRLDEAIAALEGPIGPYDETIEQMMLYHALVEEINR